jgi:type IV fimbrial biogenesis protein FimT
MRHQYPVSCQTGFTLPEILLTMIIASILLMLSAQSSFGRIQKTAIQTDIHLLQQHLNLARLSAVNRGTNIIVCPSSNSTQCNSEPNWHLGWIIFTDQNQNRQYDDNEEIIRIKNQSRKNIQITSSQFRPLVVFSASGFSIGTNLTISACDTTHQASPLHLVMSLSGRSRITKISPTENAQICAIH